MLDIDIAYPEFVPNQILTDKQLNQLRTHLEQEDRVTRLRLAGMGIACGLVARAVSGPSAVEIDAGYGITSDGDLIELCPKGTYTGWRAYADPDKDEEGKFKYVPWQTPSAPKTQIDIVELLLKADMEAADPDERPQGGTTFTAASLTAKTAGRVVVLYVEHEPVDLKSCLVTSCDNKGRNINVHVRALLVKKSDLTALAAPAADPLVFSVPRLHTTGVLHGGITALQLNQAFRQIVSASVGAFGPAVKALFDAHAPFLNIDTLAAANPFATSLSNAAHAGQYQYDALRDFVAAYHEAAAGAYGLIEQCCPTGAFPRHLMLGVVDGSAPAGWRNQFEPAAIRNAMHGEFARVRDQFRRLAAMIADLHLESMPGAAVIRASHTSAYPLGRRARPAYFAGATVESLWRPRRRGTFAPEWPWTNPLTTNLANDYADQTFLRIEGHVGRPWKTASADLVAARHAGNAEFDILCSFLDGAAAQEHGARADWWDAVAKDTEMVEAALDTFGGWIIGGKDPDIGKIAALAKAREEQLAKLAQQSETWLTLRRRRPLRCGFDALEQDYLQARAELLCAARRAAAIAARYLADLPRLTDDQLTGSGQEASLAGGQVMLARALAASLFLGPGGWDSEQHIKDRIEGLDVSAGAAATRSALGVAVAALVRVLQAVGDSTTLPRDVSAFDYELLAYVFRLAAAQSLEVWHWARALGVQVPGARYDFDSGADLPLDRAEDASMARDWLGLSGCVLARFAAIAAQYEAMRAADPSLFANLAKIDGLEHLAGVSKGGTFILLCDTVADGTVVADFSLDSRLPCCCDADPDGCMPPLALADVRVITLPHAFAGGGKFNADKKVAFGEQAFAVTIDVLANDGDLGDPKAGLKLTLQSERSQLGNEIKIAGEKTIEYAVRNPIPGVVDRFDYVVEQTEKCDGKAIGTVIVVFAMETAAPSGIRGMVLGPAGPVDGAKVTIDGTDIFETTTPDGRFEYRRMPPGEYVLVATAQGLTTDRAQASVRAGSVSEDILFVLLNADVAPAKGQIVVRVMDQTGAVLPGAMVRVVKDNDQPRQMVTDAQGIAVAKGLPAGLYTITAQVAGALSVSTSQQLAEGASEVVTIVMKPQKFEVAPGTITLVADNANTGFVVTGVAVRDAMNERYAKYVTTFNEAGSNPVVTASDPYKEAATFLESRVTDPAVADATITAEYQSVAANLADSAKTGSDAEKAAYQKALTAVTAAYLDRVAASNPAKLSVDTATDVNTAVNTLKAGGVAVDTFKTVWNGGALETNVGIRSGVTIAKVVK